jgi:hypothetical protein
VEPLINRRVSAEHVQGFSSSLGVHADNNLSTAHLQLSLTCLSLDTHRFFPSALSDHAFPSFLFWQYDISLPVLADAAQQMKDRSMDS